MGAARFTYTDVTKLHPAKDALAKMAKAMGGVEAWQATAATFADLRAAGVLLDDLIWLASSRHDKDTERRVLLWLADCLAHGAGKISNLHAQEAFGRCVIAQRAFAHGTGSEDDWERAARDAERTFATRSTWDDPDAWKDRSNRDASAVYAAVACKGGWGMRRVKNPWTGWGTMPRGIRRAISTWLSIRVVWPGWAALPAWRIQGAWGTGCATDVWGAWEAFSTSPEWNPNDAIATRASEDFEAAWQFDHLIHRMSDEEPEDLPLPTVLAERR